MDDISFRDESGLRYDEPRVIRSLSANRNIPLQNKNPFSSLSTAKETTSKTAHNALNYHHFVDGKTHVHPVLPSTKNDFPISVFPRPCAGKNTTCILRDEAHESLQL